LLVVPRAGDRPGIEAGSGRRRDIHHPSFVTGKELKPVFFFEFGNLFA
jgi:hypothetical protein